MPFRQKPGSADGYAYPFECSRLDLHPCYERLRRDEPVAPIVMPNGESAWLVTRWADVRDVLADEEVFSRALAAGRSTQRREEVFITDMDSPDHTRIRRLARHAFTNRRVRELRPRIQQVTDELVTAMAAHGQPADLITHLALPLPVTIISELLGVPARDRDQFVGWSEAFLTVSAYTAEEAAIAQQNLGGYIANMIAMRREHPGNDLLSDLVHARNDDEVLSEAELVNLGIAILVAGFETTASIIGGCVYLLLTQPGGLAQLRADPELVPNAVEELLRMVPVLTDDGLPRVATRDVEVAGLLIREGDTVLVSRDSANRDEKVFPDPDNLDFGQDAGGHLAFGHGPHFCMGANLARIELQIAIGTVVERFPDLRLAVREADLMWKQGSAMRGLLALPVTWGD